MKILSWVVLGFVALIAWIIYTHLPWWLFGIIYGIGSFVYVQKSEQRKARRNQ